MASTYEPIATTTVSAQSTVSFTSIPSTYTDLILVCTGKSSLTNVSVYRARFNNDTGTNYSDTNLSGNGTTASSARDTTQSAMYWGSVDSTSGTENPISIIHIMNYSNTNTYKTTLDRGNAASTEVVTHVNLWRSTAAINQIDLFIASQTLTGTFTLYGIKAA